MIIYIVGSSHEKSGIFTFGLKLLSFFGEEMVLALLDSKLNAPSHGSALLFQIEESHNPGGIARRILNSRRMWPNKLAILPNNSACGYEIAKILMAEYMRLNVVASITAIVHSNISSSLRLVRDNYFLVDRVYGVSKAIVNGLKAADAEPICCHLLPYAMPKQLIKRSETGSTNSSDRINVIYVGRLVEDQKRVSRLIAIVEVLRARKTKFRLEIIGDGHVAAELARVSLSHPDGVRDVVMRGELSQARVLEAMSNSDVLVLTSEFEGSPFVVMEAMSVGAVPVVMNYGPEVAELITHGKNGCVAEQGRVDEMADMLELLANDRKKLSELRNNALARASEFMSFNAWRDEICRPTPKRLIRNDHRKTSYVEIWERIKRSVKKIQTDNKVLIWGGGHIGRLIVDELISNKKQVDGCVVVDRVLHKYISRYREVPYYSSEKLPEEKFDVAIVASEYYAAEIQATLEDLKRNHNPTLHITAVRDWR